MIFKFTGLDTETVKGKAVLVCTPTYALLYPKTFKTIFDFLASKDKKFCAYNLDYDVRAMLCYLPPKNLRDLSIFGRTEYKRYKLRYIPRKFFSVREHTDGKKHRQRKGFDVYDCYQFYQTSLNKAAKKILGVGKKDIPQTWLDDMTIPLRTPRHKEKVISYCKTDAYLCEKLFDNLSRQFHQLSIDFSRPISAGSLALKTFGSKMKNQLPYWQHESQRRIYYGGRVEVFKRGYFKNCYIYDISSAYPHALSTFYDPSACYQKVSPGYDKHAAYGIYDIQVKIPSTLYVSPLPCDLLGFDYDPMMLTYPSGTFRIRVDKYSMEIALPYVTKIFYARQWFPSTHEKWFPEIPDLFLERKRRTDISLAVKLVLNSLYGKFAERREMIIPATYPGKQDAFYVEKKGFLRKIKVGTRHTNFLVAAHITGFTRAALYKAMTNMPSNKLISCATDGIITRGRILNLAGPVRLGGWQEKGCAKELISLGSGIYAYHDGIGWINKFRGYRTNKDIVDLLKEKRRTTVTIKVKTVNSLQECVRRGEIQRLNEMLLETRFLDVNFDRKRSWNKTFATAGEVLTTQIDSKTLISG